VITGDIPGQEIEYPMAVVILGGLVTSTLLNLFVVPVFYLRLGPIARPAFDDQAWAALRTNGGGRRRLWQSEPAG
jgi:hypothetical protein